MGNTYKLSDYTKKKLVGAFLYPKASTPGMYSRSPAKPKG